MNQHQKIRPANSDFKSCFAAVAAYLGRPSAETVLFSGVPISSDRIEIDEIRQPRRTHRPGGHAVRSPRFLARALRPSGDHLPRQPAAGRAADGNARTAAGYVTAPQDDGRTSISQDQPARQPDCRRHLLLDLLCQLGGGHECRLAQKIERRHWLTGTLGQFWRSYYRVALAAVFINLIAIASPIFTMNVYDRILPNKAIATLWVLAIGVGMAILFDLLLKTARAALIDHAGRKADLRISYLLFEKVLNTSLVGAARPRPANMPTA